MFKHVGVEAWDVHDWEDGESADNNGPEEEFVGVDIREEGELVFGLVGVETEHGAADGLEFPGGDEDEPG